MSQTTETQQKKEILKIPFPEDKIIENIKDEEEKIKLKEEFEKEVSLLIPQSYKDDIWSESAKSKYRNLKISIVQRSLPIFCSIFMSLVGEHPDKNVKVTLRGFEFSYAEEYGTLGKIEEYKPQQSGSNKDFKSYPLEEIFIGTNQMANALLQGDKNKKWYYVTALMSHDNTVQVVLKRNRVS